MASFDPAPGVDIQRAQIEQKLSNLKQTYFDTVLETAILDVQDPGSTSEAQQAKNRRLVELRRQSVNCSKGAEAMQTMLDALPAEKVPDIKPADETPID